MSYLVFVLCLVDEVKEIKTFLGEFCDGYKPKGEVRNDRRTVVNKLEKYKVTCHE